MIDWQGAVTVPQLFGVSYVNVSQGSLFDSKDFRCFYCGGPCNNDLRSIDLVKQSFTSRDTVAGGDYVCAGCVAAMDERADVTLCDGERRSRQKVRCYSWVITRDAAVAATKAHRMWLCDVCLNPPAPPFAVVLSDSGQKHLLYRGVVCHSREVVSVTLEDQRVTYRPVQLSDRIELCKRIVAVVGKPGAKAQIGVMAGVRIIEETGDESLPDEWERVHGEPLTALGLWLCPNREECRRACEKENQSR